MGAVHDPMTPQAYAALRKQVGSQEAVARAKGVHPSTVAHREGGRNRVTREAELALRYLSEHPELLEDPRGSVES